VVRLVVAMVAFVFAFSLLHFLATFVVAVGVEGCRRARASQARAASAVAALAQGGELAGTPRHSPMKQRRHSVR